MKLAYLNGVTSVILRVKLLDSTSTTGAGKTALDHTAAGLIISTIADTESAATVYTSAGSTVEAVTTNGTFSAPTATKCRFKKIDDTNHPGIYEIQIADARWAVSNAKSIIVSVQATGVVPVDAEVQLSVVPSDSRQWLGGTIPAVNQTGVPLVDAKYLLGTIFSTPATAGVMDINLKNVNNVAYGSSTLNTLASHDPGATIGTSTLTQSQVTGGAYALSTDANGRIRIVDGTAAGELDTSSGLVTLAATQAFNNTGTWTGNIVGTLSTLTTYTGNTPQTGDSFARIGATGSGLTSLAPSATALSTVQWTNTLATNLGTLAGHDPGATLGTSTLTQTQVSGGAYAINSPSFAFDSALDLTTAQAASVQSQAGTALSNIRLDTLLKSAVPSSFSATVNNNSVIGYLAASATTGNYDRTLMSLQANGENIGLDGAGLISLGDTRLANLDATVSSRSTLTQSQVTGGAYALDTDANGRIRIVDGTAAGELDTSSGKVSLAATQTFDNTGTWTGNLSGSIGSIATDGIAAASISTAAANKQADITLRRTPTNLEASSFGDTLGMGSLYGLIQQAQKSDTTTHAGKLTVFKVNGTTELGQLTLTTDPAAEPITSAL